MVEVNMPTYMAFVKYISGIRMKWRMSRNRSNYRTEIKAEDGTIVAKQVPIDAYHFQYFVDEEWYNKYRGR